MNDDAAGAVRRTPRPAGAVLALWWSPSEQALWEKDEDGYFCPDYYPIKSSTVLPGDAVQLVGPDQRRPVVLLPAEDCDCTPPYADCPHGPEPVDALDLAVWLHAEQTWRVEQLLPLIDEREEWRRGARADAAERDELRARLDEQKQTLDLVRAQNDDVVEQVDAALGHRYHKPTVHYSVPHVAKKAAAELKQRQARIDAALALIAKGLKWGPFLDPDETRAVLAALQGDQPIEPDERLAGLARPAEGVQLIADAFGIAPAEAAAQLRDAIRAAARSDLDEPGQPTGEAGRG